MKTHKGLEIISWLDHCTFSDNIWRKVSEIKELEPVLVRTVGWVIHEDTTKVILVSTVAEDRDAANEFCIIKGCITKRQKVKED